MSQQETATMPSHDNGHDNGVFRALADSRRRQTLQVLTDRVSAVNVEELAVHIAAAEQDTSLVAVTDEDVEELLVDLHHVQIPALVDAGLVTWEDEQAVTTTDHPCLGDPKFERIIETEAADWDAVVGNLADRRRRVVLSVLEDEPAHVTLRALATKVAARTDGEDGDKIDAVYASLHHVHLPKLADAGLVEYDADDGTVAYVGHPELEEEWLEFEGDETPRAILPSAQDAEGIWTIEGRDNVIARGQSLFEQADDELFLMFTTDGLLEEGCIRRLQDAIDRGVDVYLGSQTQEVRDLVRERVPEAVIWEPQMDWLNLPPKYEKVGRLVFADRRAIMLATLGEKGERGIHREKAITGDGENNPLVMLVREMLGSRLDHLDTQSEEFLSEVPL